MFSLQCSLDHTDTKMQLYSAKILIYSLCLSGFKKVNLIRWKWVCQPRFEVTNKTNN